MIGKSHFDSGGNAVRIQGPGDTLMDESAFFPITTVGSGTLSAAAMNAGIVERTGPVGAYADVLDTADNLMATLGNVSPGDSFEFWFRNTVAFANTVAVSEGAELSGSFTAVAASLVRRYLVTIFATARRQSWLLTTTNASAVVTGLTQSQAQVLQPGMGITGTNIPAATTVLSVNSVTGTVTLSAAATGSASNAMTFFPRYNIRGISSATL